MYIFVDGADSSANTTTAIRQKWDYTSQGSDSTWSSNSGRFGAGAYVGGGSTASYFFLGKNIPPSGSAVTTDEFFLAYWFKAGVVTNSTFLVLGNSYLNGNGSTFSATEFTTQLSVALASGVLVLRRGATTIATGTTVIDPNLWYWLSIRAVVGNSGLFELRLNNVAEMTFSGDTYDSGDTNIKSVTLRTTQASHFVDDVIMWNSISGNNEPTTWIDPIRIDTLRPTADGDNSDSTANTGSRWDAVNDVSADGDTTYVSATTVGAKDLYACADLSDVPDSILAVCTFTRWKNQGTTSRKAKTKLKRASSVVDSPARTLPFGAYGNVQDFFPQDPSTSAAWTPSGVNAVQIGWEIDT